MYKCLPATRLACSPSVTLYISAGNKPCASPCVLVIDCASLAVDRQYTFPFFSSTQNLRNCTPYLPSVARSFWCAAITSAKLTLPGPRSCSSMNRLLLPVSATVGVVADAVGGLVFTGCSQEANKAAIIIPGRKNDLITLIFKKCVKCLSIFFVMCKINACHP